MAKAKPTNTTKFLLEGDYYVLITTSRKYQFDGKLLSLHVVENTTDECTDDSVYLFTPDELVLLAKQKKKKQMQEFKRRQERTRKRLEREAKKNAH